MRRGVALALALVCCRTGGRPSPQPSDDAGADVDAAPPCTTPYPAGPYGTTAGAILRNYTWPGLGADGSARTIALGDHLEACASVASLLVVRVGAAWCGTCQWYAAHSRVLAASDVGPRLRVLDVLVRGQDNGPAAMEDASAWRALQDTPADIAVDSSFTLSELLPARTALPYLLLVDARTMTLLDALPMPTEDGIESHARSALATLDGLAAPPPPPPVLVDGRFSRDQWGLVTAMSLHDPPPPDTTNAFADVLGAGALGSVIFVDTTLSPSNMVACASCHEPPRQLTDGRPTSPEGEGPVPRNSPSLVLAAYQPWQFWDGRADSLWSQALMPMENPNEFGSSRLFVAHDVYSFYRAPYESLFGAMPPLGDLQRFPAAGMPGDAAWAAMAPADQDAVTRVFVNVGKALAAYERSLRGTSFVLDSYAGGDLAALTGPQKDGLLAYLQGGCAQCHWGPRLTDDSFHNLRFPTGRQDGTADMGRMGGIPQYVAGEFSAGSVYSDDRSRARPPPQAGAWTLGAFKTPSLRNVALTSPYGHGGSYVALTDVVELHRAAGLPAGSKLTTGTADPWLPAFDPSQDAPLVAFLQTLAMGFAH